MRNLKFSVILLQAFAIASLSACKAKQTAQNPAGTKDNPPNVDDLGGSSMLEVNGVTLAPFVSQYVTTAATDAGNKMTLVISSSAAKRGDLEATCPGPAHSDIATVCSPDPTKAYSQFIVTGNEAAEADSSLIIDSATLVVSPDGCKTVSYQVTATGGVVGASFTSAKACADDKALFVFDNLALSRTITKDDGSSVPETIHVAGAVTALMLKSGLASGCAQAACISKSATSKIGTGIDNPGDPIDPSNPEDPTNPGNPTDPQEPTAKLGSISGVIWNDADADGIFDLTETPTGARPVFIDANKNGKLDAGELTVTADAKGMYKFNNLKPGAYFVSREFPVGYHISNSKTTYVSVTLKDGENATGINIGTATDTKTDPVSPITYPTKAGVITSVDYGKVKGYVCVPKSQPSVPYLDLKTLSGTVLSANVALGAAPSGTTICSTTLAEKAMTFKYALSADQINSLSNSPIVATAHWDATHSKALEASARAFVTLKNYCSYANPDVKAPANAATNLGCRALTYGEICSSLGTMTKDSAGRSVCSYTEAARKTNGMMDYFTGVTMRVGTQSGCTFSVVAGGRSIVFSPTCAPAKAGDVGQRVWLYYRDGDGL